MTNSQKETFYNAVAISCGLMFVIGVFAIGLPALYKHDQTEYCRSTMVKDFGALPTHRIYWQDGRCVVEAE